MGGTIALVTERDHRSILQEGTIGREHSSSSQEWIIMWLIGIDHNSRFTGKYHSSSPCEGNTALALRRGLQLWHMGDELSSWSNRGDYSSSSQGNNHSSGSQDKNTDLGLWETITASGSWARTTAPGSEKSSNFNYTVSYHFLVSVTLSTWLYLCLVFKEKKNVSVQQTVNSYLLAWMSHWENFSIGKIPHILFLLKGTNWGTVLQVKDLVGFFGFCIFTSSSLARGISAETSYWSHVLS